MEQSDFAKIILGYMENGKPNKFKKKELLNTSYFLEGSDDKRIVIKDVKDIYPNIAFFMFKKT